MTSTLPVFVVDRGTCLSRLILVETITSYLERYAVVHVEDRSRPIRMRLCYEVRPSEAAFYWFSAHGHPTGVFASIDALVDHAETATAM